jgi:hypothetical protein
MDYFNDAFGGFRPDSDEDAALKFSLCVLALDNRMDELLRLVEGGGNFGGVEGDPGWIIERREDEDIVGYEGWPADARFRAYVEPESYSLSHPEFYASRQTFFEYVGSLIGAYKRRNPERAEVVRHIEEALARGR